MENHCLQYWVRKWIAVQIYKEVALKRNVQSILK